MTTTSVEGVDYIDEIEFYKEPSRRVVEMHIRRTYQRLAESMTMAKQLPAWLQFQRARQGSE